MSKKTFLENTKKIKSSDFNLYIFENGNWVLKDEKIPKSILKIINIYEKEKNMNHLIDDVLKDFLKGELNALNAPSGKRIYILPNGKKLARGGFSIFAKNLKFNENGDKLWDVVYENTSGTKTYLYCEDKVHLEHKKKAKIVDDFTKAFPKIMKYLEKDIRTKKDPIYLALWIMIKTFIRVGDINYYNHLGHKGLTTLQKKDLTIKDNSIIFNFIGKDGVPQNIEKEFDDFIIKKMKKVLGEKKSNDFVFTKKDESILHSMQFSKVLFDYTGKHFYPHIIRSFHADSLCKTFIDSHKNKATKKEVEEKFLEIAKDLGHKKFNKKKNEWVINYKVTIENYIRPSYSEKMIEMTK